MFPSILKWKHNLSVSLNSNNVKFLKDNQYRSSFNYHFRASKKKLLIKWTERSITKVEKKIDCWLPLISINETKDIKNDLYTKRRITFFAKKTIKRIKYDRKVTPLKKTREKEYYEIAWKCHIWNEWTYVEQKKEKLRVSEWIVPGLWEIFSQKRWQTQNSFPFKLSHWVFLSFGNDFNGKMTFF